MSKKRAYLSALDLFGIKIVSFSDIEVGGEVFLRHALKHALFDHDVMIEALVLLMLKVIHYGDLGWVVFQHELNWDRGH